MNRKAKDIFVFIEPVNHGYKVVLAAKAMGYQIAAIHKMPLFAPSPYEQALEAIDVDIEVESWRDFDALDEMIDREFADCNIVGTYAGAEITLEFDAALRRRVSLPGTPTEVIKACLNKYNVRDTLSKSGLTKLQYLNKQQVLECQTWNFDGAYYFKPCYGGGSTKVFKCENMEDLQHAINSWYDKSDIHLAFLRDYLELYDEFILEQAAVGELVSVEALTFEGQVSILGITSRTLLARDPIVEMGATFPYSHKFAEQIFEKVASVHSALGIVHGPTHTEVIVSADGEIEVVEVNLRFAGADVLEICCRAYDQDIGRSLVRLGAGMEPDLPTEPAPNYSTVQYILAPKTVTRFESLEFTPKANFSRVQKPLNEDLKSTDNQIDHVGCFIMTDDSYDRLMDNAKAERYHIKINGAILEDDPNNAVILR